MKQITSEQLGSALRRLATDLVEERRRVALLERDNEALRKRIEALERALSEQRDHPVNAEKAA